VVLTVPSAAPILTAVKIQGAVHPTQTGQVRLQVLRSGAWRWISTAVLSSTGHYVFTVKLPAKSTYSYRVRRPGDANQAGNVSAVGRVLCVDRTLRSGLSGPDVTALQRRLR